MTWSSIIIVASAAACRIAIPSPHPPGGNPAGGAVELDDRRARDLERLAPVGSVERGPGRDLGRPDGDELDLRARGPRTRSAPRAHGGTLREVAAERHGQLERLAAVAEVGLALRGSSPASASGQT